MLEIILVRHGETEGNLRPTAIGTTDLPLTERGRRQAYSLSRMFALKKPDAIYASTLKRAMDTAEMIAQPHDLSIEPVLDLGERNFGLLENRTLDSIRTEFEEEYDAWQADLAGYVMPGGESMQTVYDRSVRTIEAILKRHEEGSVIVVSHYNPIRAMLAHLLGMGIEGLWRFEVKNGAACRLEIQGSHAVLTAFNEI